MNSKFHFDVFLSHSSKDKEIVRHMAECLRNAGLRVWFDEWAMLPGDNIPTKIEEGLEHSRVLVLCMSANAFDSDWTQLESQTIRFRDPLNKERRLIPLRLDKAPIRGSLAQFLYIKWYPETRDQELQNLLNACRPPAESDVNNSKTTKSDNADNEFQTNIFTNNNFIGFPLEVQGILRIGEKHESKGEVWDAVNSYREASHILGTNSS